MANATRPSDEVVISVDSHVNEPEELWDALPEEMRQYRPTSEPLPDGGEIDSIEGNRIRLTLQEEMTEDDWDCEYRRDPSGGVDLDYLASKRIPRAAV
jgi:hypothetical protein